MIREFAPAKVNLYLHVTGRRDDGYHLLDSLAVFVDAGDDLTVEPGDGLSLTVDGPGAAALTALTAEGDNIVLRAARALAQAAGKPADLRIRLTKRLPTAAGIGGGSADAAALLRGLSRLWGLSLPDVETAKIALSLGADVPVCLRGRPTRMRGIGDVLDDAPALPPVWLVLTNPRIPVSTPAVFKARTACFSEFAPLDRRPADAAALADMLRLRRNDLEPPAVGLAPEIADALQILQAQPGCLLARMSGSGATCFGFFADPTAADAAETAICAAKPSWWTKSTKMISAS